MAAVARLSPYHFARQFKAATGVPPHQYVIARRVERAKQLLQGGGDFSHARVAAHAGFSDLSHSPIISSASSASRPDNSACPQETPKPPQLAPRIRTASPLVFSHDRGSCRPSFAGGS
jgi:AraC-like DNA-binding protein